MIKLDKSMLLGEGTDRDQARGAKIGGKDMAPPSSRIVLETDRLLGQDERGQAAGAKIGLSKT
jgi:hypothetical protein